MQAHKINYYTKRAIDSINRVDKINGDNQTPITINYFFFLLILDLILLRTCT